MLSRIHTAYFTYRLSDGYIKVENTYTRKSKDIKIPGRIKVADTYNDVLHVICMVDGVKHQLEIQPKTMYSVRVFRTVGETGENEETEEVIKFSRNRS